MNFMKILSAGGILAPILLLGSPASAQETGSMQVGGATVSIGGGTAILTLPDVTSMVTRVNGVTPFALQQSFKFSDDFGDELGWNINGSVIVPMGANQSFALSGFWARIDDKDGFTCTAQTNAQACGIGNLVDDPAVTDSFFSPGFFQLITSAEREVDQWGVSLESKWQLSPSVMGITRAPSRRYIALGGDIRGIDQDISSVTTSPAVGFPVSFTYNENLDTSYYGAYLAYGGDYEPLLFRGLWQRTGLQSSFRLQGGIYSAKTDFDGRLIQTVLGGVDPSSALSLSEDEVAFIGGVTLETRKRLGARATLSLKSDYEYYSYVPRMRYNTFDLGPANVSAGHQQGTVIDDDDAFSARTMLTLKIKLGPRAIMEPYK